MAVIRCPRCGTRNTVEPGTVIVTCSNCAANFRVVGELGNDASAAPSGPGAMSELGTFFGDLFRSRGLIIGGSIGLLVLFIGFWLLLHLMIGSSSSNSSMSTHSQASGIVKNPAYVGETPETPPPPPQPAPVITTPPVVTPPTPPAPVRPPPAPVERPPALTDDQIGDAIHRGVDFLISCFDPDTGLVKASAMTNDKQDEPWLHGLNHLCVYALAQASQTESDPRLNSKSPFMNKAILAMRHSADDAHYVTYARSVRASALGLLNRPSDRADFEIDVNWLLRASREGAYTYNLPAANATSLDWDNSNSQYGLYGVWSGAEAGLPISQRYWESIDRHWVACQLPDGGFGYRPGETATLSMTVAGVASLFVAHDYLAASATPFGVDPLPGLKKAMDWLETDDRAVTFDLNRELYGPYTLYGVARAGLASGYKYFGKHDWFEELAPRVLKNQKEDGSFNGRLVDTCFSILFLVRGRQPVILDKLRPDGAVFVHPRDAANLARYASRQLERPLNAQVVSLTRDWPSWSDVPVVYLTGWTPPAISDNTADQLRKYVRAGGLLFTHADANANSYSTFAQKLADRLFPEYPMVDLPDDSPLYTSLYKLKVRPKLRAVSNGARLLMVHSPKDLAVDWDKHDYTQAEDSYQFGLNLYVYASGRSEFRNRLDSNYLPPPASPSTWTVPVARLQYAGNWDPEPYAWTRFASYLQWQTGYTANTIPVNLRDLSAKAPPLAHLTGTAAYSFAPKEIDNLRLYVQNGGLLVIDVCGGAKAFAQSESALIAAAFPEATPQHLTAAHPLLNGQGACMDRLPSVLPRSPGMTVPLPSIFAFGKGHVVFTPVDLTCGLLNTGTLGITGYRPTYAQSFLKNLVLWSLEGQKEPAG